MRFNEGQFFKSLNDIPMGDVFGTIERECRRIENTSLSKQLPLDESAASILIFRRFINAVMLGVRLTHCVLPAQHMAIYRKIVARLVEAKRLPAGANDEFGKTFSAAKGERECVKRADAGFLAIEK